MFLAIMFYLNRLTTSTSVLVVVNERFSGIYEMQRFGTSSKRLWTPPCNAALKSEALIERQGEIFFMNEIEFDNR